VSTTGGPVQYHFEYGQDDALQQTPGHTRELAASRTGVASGAA
jgi:hypothetical protein